MVFCLFYFNWRNASILFVVDGYSRHPHPNRYGVLRVQACFEWGAKQQTANNDTSTGECIASSLQIGGILGVPLKRSVWVWFLLKCLVQHYLMNQPRHFRFVGQPCDCFFSWIRDLSSWFYTSYYLSKNVVDSIWMFTQTIIERWVWVVLSDISVTSGGFIPCSVLLGWTRMWFSPIILSHVSVFPNKIFGI